MSPGGTAQLWPFPFFVIFFHSFFFYVGGIKCCTRHTFIGFALCFFIFYSWKPLSVPSALTWNGCCAKWQQFSETAENSAAERHWLIFHQVKFFVGPAEFCIKPFDSNSFSNSSTSGFSFVKRWPLIVGADKATPTYKATDYTGTWRHVTEAGLSLAIRYAWEGAQQWLV